jgi:hypothetical protein
MGNLKTLVATVWLTAGFGALLGCSSSNKTPSQAGMATTTGGETSEPSANAEAGMATEEPTTNSGGSSSAAGDGDAGAATVDPSTPSPHGDADQLVGNWQFLSQDPTFAIVLHYKSDGSYESDVVTFPTANLWRAQIEIGTYTVSGSMVTTTPTQWSCPGPDPVATATFSLSNGTLVLANASGAVTLSPQEHPEAPANVGVTIGCFSDNSFTAMPLAPVTN